MLTSGLTNSITDIDGLLVGNAQDDSLKSGVTVLTADQPFTSGISIMGGAPGTRDVALLAPDKTVQQVDALVLSGGSAFGLDAASGVMKGLRNEGRGMPIGPARIPIVPTAILFDLLNGGDKNWTENPYPTLGREAYDNRSSEFGIGSIGAGTGATTADLKGGLGTASTVLPSGHTVGALVAVNAMGSVLSGKGPHFLAAPWELHDEFGGLGPVLSCDPTKLPPIKLAPTSNTTIAIVATDAVLDQAQCTRMATAAHDGIARAIQPAHTPMDGDLIFAVSTGNLPAKSEDLIWLGHVAATCLARAIARAVFSATPFATDKVPTWSHHFGVS